jgi:hypothetical protein
MMDIHTLRSRLEAAIAADDVPAMAEFCLRHARLVSGGRPEETRWRNEALQRIGYSQAQVQQWDEARETARSLPAELGLSVLEALVTAQGNAEAWEEALATAMAIGDEVRRNQVLTRIALDQRDAGWHQEALATANGISDAQNRYLAWGQLADAHARDGRKAQAREILQIALDAAGSIPDETQRHEALGSLVSALAQVGWDDIARDIVLRYPDSEQRDEGLALIALVQTYRASWEEARETAQQIHGEDRRQRMQALALWQQTREGPIHELLERASNLPDPERRSQALAHLAGRLAESGQTDQARELLRVAVTTVQEQVDPERHPAVFADLATSMGLRGFWKEARETADRVEPGCLRDSALRAIAGNQARAGSWSESLATLAAVEDSMSCVHELVKVAYLEHQGGQAQQVGRALLAAREFALRVPDASWLSEGLSQIASAQAYTGWAAESVQTALEIAVNRNKHLPWVAEFLARANEREHFKRLLLPSAHYLDSAYQMCAALVELSPQHASSVAGIVQRH